MPKDIVQIQPQEPTAGVVSEIQPTEPHAEIDSDLPSPKESLDITLAEETPVLDVTESDEPRSPTAERELPSEEGQMKTTETLSETGVSKTKEKKKTKKPKKTSKDKGRGEEEVPSDFQEIKPDSTEPQIVTTEGDKKLITQPLPETVAVPTEQVQQIEKHKETPLERPKDSVQIEPQEPTLVVFEIQPTALQAEIQIEPALPPPKGTVTQKPLSHDLEVTASEDSPDLEFSIAQDLLSSEDCTKPTTYKASDATVSKLETVVSCKVIEIKKQPLFIDLIKEAVQEITKGVEAICADDYPKAQILAPEVSFILDDNDDLGIIKQTTDKDTDYLDTDYNVDLTELQSGSQKQNLDKIKQTDKRDSIICNVEIQVDQTLKEKDFKDFEGSSPSVSEEKVPEAAQGSQVEGMELECVKMHDDLHVVQSITAELQHQQAQSITNLDIDTADHIEFMLDVLIDKGNVQETHVELQSDRPDEIQQEESEMKERHIVKMDPDAKQVHVDLHGDSKFKSEDKNQDIGTASQMGGLQDSKVTEDMLSDLQVVESKKIIKLDVLEDTKIIKKSKPIQTLQDHLEDLEKERKLLEDSVDPTSQDSQEYILKRAEAVGSETPEVKIGLRTSTEDEQNKIFTKSSQDDATKTTCKDLEAKVKETFFRDTVAGQVPQSLEDITAVLDKSDMPVFEINTQIEETITITTEQIERFRSDRSPDRRPTGEITTVEVHEPTSLVFAVKPHELAATFAQISLAEIDTMEPGETEIRVKLLKTTKEAEEAEDEMVAEEKTSPICYLQVDIPKSQEENENVFVTIVKEPQIEIETSIQSTDEGTLSEAAAKTIKIEVQGSRPETRDRVQNEAVILLPEEPYKTKTDVVEISLYEQGLQKMQKEPEVRVITTTTETTVEENVLEIEPKVDSEMIGVDESIPAELYKISDVKQISSPTETKSEEMEQCKFDIETKPSGLSDQEITTQDQVPAQEDTVGESVGSASKGQPDSGIRIVDAIKIQTQEKPIQAVSIEKQTTPKGQETKPQKSFIELMKEAAREITLGVESIVTGVSPQTQTSVEEEPDSPELIHKQPELTPYSGIQLESKTIETDNEQIATKTPPMEEGDSDKPTDLVKVKKQPVIEDAKQDKIKQDHPTEDIKEVVKIYQDQDITEEQQQFKPSEPIQETKTVPEKSFVVMMRVAAQALEQEIEQPKLATQDKDDDVFVKEDLAIAQTELQETKQEILSEVAMRPSDEDKDLVKEVPEISHRRLRRQESVGVIEDPGVSPTEVAETFTDTLTTMQFQPTQKIESRKVIPSKSKTTIFETAVKKEKVPVLQGERRESVGDEPPKKQVYAEIGAERLQEPKIETAKEKMDKHLGTDTSDTIQPTSDVLPTVTPQEAESTKALPSIVVDAVNQMVQTTIREATTLIPRPDTVHDAVETINITPKEQSTDKTEDQDLELDRVLPVEQATQVVKLSSIMQEEAITEPEETDVRKILALNELKLVETSISSSVTEPTKTTTLETIATHEMVQTSREKKHPEAMADIAQPSIDTKATTELEKSKLTKTVALEALEMVETACVTPEFEQPSTKPQQRVTSSISTLNATQDKDEPQKTDKTDDDMLVIVVKEHEDNTEPKLAIESKTDTDEFVSPATGTTEEAQELTILLTAEPPAEFEVLEIPVETSKIEGVDVEKSDQTEEKSKEVIPFESEVESYEKMTATDTKTQTDELDSPVTEEIQEAELTILLTSEPPAVEQTELEFEVLEIPKQPSQMQALDDSSDNEKYEEVEVHVKDWDRPRQPKSEIASTIQDQGDARTPEELAPSMSSQIEETAVVVYETVTETIVKVKMQEKMKQEAVPFERGPEFDPKQTSIELQMPEQVTKEPSQEGDTEEIQQEGAKQSKVIKTAEYPEMTPTTSADEVQIQELETPQETWEDAEESLTESEVVEEEVWKEPEESVLRGIFSEIDLLVESGPSCQLLKVRPVEESPETQFTSTRAAPEQDRTNQLHCKVLVCKNQPATLSPTDVEQQLKQAKECREAAKAQVALLSEQRRGGEVSSQASELVEDQWRSSVQDLDSVIEKKEAELQLVTDYSKQLEEVETSLEELRRELDIVTESPGESCSEEAERLSSLQRTLEKRRTIFIQLMIIYRKLYIIFPKCERAAVQNTLKTLQSQWRLIEKTVEKSLYNKNAIIYETDSIKTEMTNLQGQLADIADELNNIKNEEWNCNEAQNLIILNAELSAANEKFCYLKAQTDKILPNSQWEKDTKEIQDGIQGIENKLGQIEKTIISKTKISSNPIMEKIVAVIRDAFAWAKKTETDIESRQKRVSLLPEQVHHQLRDLKKLQSEVMTNQGQLEELVEEVNELLPQLDEEEEIPMISASLKSLEELSKLTAEKLVSAIRKTESGLQTREKLSQQIADLDAWIISYLNKESVSSPELEKSLPDLERQARKTQETQDEAEKQARICEALLVKSKEIAPELTITENCQLFDRLINLQDDIDDIVEKENVNKQEVEECIKMVESSKQKLVPIVKSIRHMLADVTRPKFPITSKSIQALQPLKNTLSEHKSQVERLEQWSSPETSKEIQGFICDLENKLSTLEPKATDHELYLNLRKFLEELKESMKDQVRKAKDETEDIEKYKRCQSLFVQFPAINVLCQELKSKLLDISTDLYPSQLSAEQQRVKQTEETLNTMETSLENSLIITEGNLLKNMDLGIEIKATVAFLKNINKDLNKKTEGKLTKADTDREYMRILTLRRTVEIRLRAWDVLKLKSKKKEPGAEDVTKLKKEVLQECDKQLESMTETRQSLRTYTATVKRVILLFHHTEVRLRHHFGLHGLCSERSDQILRSLDSLDQDFQNLTDQLKTCFPPNRLQSPAVKELQENTLSQLLVMMATVKAKGQMELEKLNSCVEQYSHYCELCDDITQRLERAEESVNELMTQKVTCLRHCSQQQEQLKSLCSEAESLQKALD
ncbi:dystonin-like [Boleophthalmus pectinirostris]|uniref:dystonin-like n=1 Tax=Boleophthalmus pectinirostris TaxID=150288 RepID=UPI0024327C17|nr:dystonin-like [Boleophthalmus pectinirostris]